MADGVHESRNRLPQVREKYQSHYFAIVILKREFEVLFRDFNYYYFYFLFFLFKQFFALKKPE